MDSTQQWFDELYIKNHKRMISIAMRLGFPPGEAEELVQDAFLLLLSKSKLFQDGHKSPIGFLMKTLRNLMGDKLRRNKIIKFVPYDEMPEAETTDTYFSSLKDHLPAALSEDEKEILVARYEAQTPYSELSKQLGISPSQCATKVFRAKKKLQEILEEEKNFS